MQGRGAFWHCATDYVPLHSQDMTASHEDGPDIDRTWLKPVKIFYRTRRATCTPSRGQRRWTSSSSG